MNHSQKKNRLTWILGGLLVVVIGWIGISEFGWLGSSDPNAVWGTVLLDGKPVTKGQLMFVPDEEKGNQGGKAFADIRQGSYSTIPSQPVSPGACIVHVSIYPEPNEGETMSMSQLVEIRSFQIEMDIPEGGASDLVVRVSSQ